MCLSAGLVRGGAAAAKWANYLFAVVPQTVITLIAVIMLLAGQGNMYSCKRSIGFYNH